MYRILISLAIAQQLMTAEGQRGCIPDSEPFTVKIRAGKTEPTKQCCSDGKPGHVWWCRTVAPYSNSVHGGRSVPGKRFKLFGKDHPIPANAKKVKCQCATRRIKIKN